MRIFPVCRRVAEIGLMGIRYGSVTHVPVTCGTLTAQLCARADPGRPKVVAARMRANRALRSIAGLPSASGVHPEQGRDGRCGTSLANVRWSPGMPEPRALGATVLPRATAMPLLRPPAVACGGYRRGARSAAPH